MIIYSVTISLDRGIEQNWLAWMQETHIPEVMATGHFEDYSFQQLLEPTVDPEMVTYNVHYHCATIEAYRAYEKNHAPKLRQAHEDRYANRFVSFRTLLKKVPAL